MPVAPVAVTTALNTDPKRVGKTVKANVVVVARDPSGKAGKFDLAELDDASAVAWLNAITDWKKRLYYRRLLATIRLAEKKAS